MSGRSTSSATVYNDPTADIVLVSTDGEVFRVHSYYLKASSSFFREMLALPRIGMTTDNHGDKIDAPAGIPIDVDSEDLTLFLGLMRISPSPAPKNWPQAHRLLKLCDQLGCDALTNRLIGQSFVLARDAHWEVFCAASHIPDVKLAKAAIRCMGNDPLKRNLSVTYIRLRDARECSLSFFLAFLQASLRSQHDERGAFIEVIDTDWNRIASRFMLLD